MQDAITRIRNVPTSVPAGHRPERRPGEKRPGQNFEEEFERQGGSTPVEPSPNPSAATTRQSVPLNHIDDEPGSLLDVVG